MKKFYNFGARSATIKQGYRGLLIGSPRTPIQELGLLFFLEIYQNHYILWDCLILWCHIKFSITKLVHKQHAALKIYFFSYILNVIIMKMSFQFND